MPARPTELTPDRSARHMFGAEMRRLREAAGMSLESLGEIIKWSKSSLARYETAESMIPPDLPARLDAAFGTSGGWFGKLYVLACKEFHPDQFRRMVELESRASLIQQYSGLIVPGLVQTEAYARAQFRVHNPRATLHDIDELVTARMSRQSLLAQNPAPDLYVLLDQAVLLHSYGGPAVMREQLARLADLACTSTTILQVLPFTHGGHPLAGGSLKLLTLDDGSRVAYEESITTGTLLEDAHVVKAHQRSYDLVRAYALSPSDSATLIRSTMEELPHEHHPGLHPRGLDEVHLQRERR